MSPPKKLRIFIVDDSRSILYHLKEILGTHFTCGEISVATDGAEAWEKIKSSSFDLIISDWNMPNMNGDELLSNVRDNESTKHTPFLLLTSRSDKDSVVGAIKAGASDYLVKPFDESDAVQRIEKLLGVKAGQ